MIISELNDKIALVCPIDGISSDGRIDFKPEATEEQKVAAQAVMDANLPFLSNTPTPQPITLTARQFFIQLANSGYVTPQEAVAAAQTGAVPNNIAAVFASLPASDAVAAQITWAKMTQVSEDEPLVAAVAAAMSLDATHIHEFFVAAAAL